MDNRPVRTGRWDLTYAGVNISARISPYVLSVTYTDNLAGEADDLEVVIENKDGRWMNGWMPEKGDLLQPTLGYRDEHPRLDAGEFQIDEVEFNGPPDTVSIRAIAAAVKATLRTSRSAGYENTTLRKIAAKVAARHGLTMVGTVPEIAIRRVTQKKETDLAFLKRLGEKWGHVFSIRGKQLIWHDQDALDKAPPVVTITRKGLAGSYTLRTKSARVYKECKVTYWNAKLKKDVTHTFTATGTTSGDTLHLVERCESKGQAEKMAKAALRKVNGRQKEGTLSLYGNPRLRAGMNVTLQGFGVFDDTYQVVKAIHRIERGGGYTTSINIGQNGSYGMKNLRNDKKLVKA
jgi:phage protein D